MIDGSNYVNIISKLAFKKIRLKADPPLQPYKVTQIDKNFHSITKYFHVLIQFSSYHNRFQCDVLSIDVAYILQGWPQLYDVDIKNFRKVKCFCIYVNGKNIILTPSPPKSQFDNQKNRLVTNKKYKKPLHFMSKNHAIELIKHIDF